MCVVAVKYFDDYGWVGVKNRDRNYKPTIAFRYSYRDSVESMYMYDLVTKYSEGINEYGVCIINAATAVKNDESEAAAARRKQKANKKLSGTYFAPDGVKIRKALKFKDPKRAVQFLADSELKGNTFVFNKDDCYLLEGGHDKKQFEYNYTQSLDIEDYEWDKMDYYYEIKQIPKDKFEVRTNHGHVLDWMGYREDAKDDAMKFSAESTRRRYDIAYNNVKKAQNPDELIQAISIVDKKEPQMAPVRIDDAMNRKLLKTTGQLYLRPYDLTLNYRPIWGDVQTDNINNLNNKKIKLNINTFRTDDYIQYLKSKLK